ncbi:hypothetical protein A9Q99_26915 [Gammaproteobacteria bacterium 45_16_T64]|nr:hypothetical protein A9Q99_26915 [Gammaproteobacteria bacterium 45_16_T64]
MATVTSHYARAALNGVKRKNVDVSPLLQMAGISDEILQASESRVHTEQLSRLIRGVWSRLGDEFMGCTPSRCKPGAFAMMCRLVSHCDTVDALFIEGIKFYDLITDDIKMEYRTASNRREFVVTFLDPDCDHDNFFLEFWLVIWHRFVSWMIGTQIKIQEVHFTYKEPAHSAEFPYQFACPCVYEAQETKICFGSKFAAMPIIRTQRELSQFLKRSPADLMTIPESDESLSAKIKASLLEEYDVSKGFPELEVIAERFHSTPQTVRRKLKDEGENYQKIKDNLRRDIAIEKLLVQHVAVSDVAELLGFSEPRSFTRAFKQWTGVTPSAYRQNKR